MNVDGVGVVPELGRGKRQDILAELTEAQHGGSGALSDIVRPL